MKKPLLLFFFLLLFAFNQSFSQEDSTIIKYINTYKNLAISEMIRTGVPASIKLAQGIHETEAGKSDLVLRSNNHFGIKCKSDWKGMSVKHTDDAPNECFRKYNDPSDSYRDHSDFLKRSERYSSLFLLDPTDYAGWANGLKKAGYATNTKYPLILIKLIENYHLQDYTLVALGKLDPSEEILVKAEQNKSSIDTSDLSIRNIVFDKPIVMEPEPEIIVIAKKPTKENNSVQRGKSISVQEKKTTPEQQKSIAKTETVNTVSVQEKKSLPEQTNIVVKTEADPLVKTVTVQQSPVIEKTLIETTPVYPEGEFKINETRVIYAKKGTPYLSIAEKYSLPLARIFEFNEMNEKEVVERDQLIYIMRKRKFGNNEQHTVKEGETLNDIAQTEALRIESLYEYNFITTGMKPVPGTVLYLRAKAPSVPTLISSK